MKKHLILPLITFMVLGSLASCKRCHVCIAKDQDGVVRHTYSEMCGSKKDLSEYADKCETEYGAFDFTCECGESVD